MSNYLGIYIFPGKMLSGGTGIQTQLEHQARFPGRFQNFDLRDVLALEIHCTAAVGQFCVPRNEIMNTFQAVWHLMFGIQFRLDGFAHLAFRLWLLEN